MPTLKNGMSPLPNGGMEEELSSICSCLQSLLPRLFAVTQDVDGDPLMRVASQEHVTHFKMLAVPAEAKDIEEVIEDAFQIYDQRLRVNHPRLMGFIPSPTSPAGFVGSVIASAFNAHGASKLLASGPVAIEKQLIEWLAERVGLPDTAAGLFVSGGSMANLMALVMARDCYLTSEQYTNGVAYVSEATHFSIEKALRILGFRKDQLRRIPGDEYSRMLPAELESTITADRAAGLAPFVVVASCGTTNTGAVDPLRIISEVCQRTRVWLHVDGAYGASVALSSKHRAAVSELRYADSLAWDPHKWLFQTYSCSILLTRHKQSFTDSFRNQGDYLRDGAGKAEDDLPNLWDYSMELTRPASRAMKLWFTLRVLGLEKIEEMIDHGFALAETAEQTLEELSDWEITSSARNSLAIVTFRFRPESCEVARLDDLNARISKTVVENDVAGILTTKINGNVVLRVCALSPQLSCTQMREIILEMDKIARDIMGSSVSLF